MMPFTHGVPCPDQLWPWIKLWKSKDYDWYSAKVSNESPWRVYLRQRPMPVQVCSPEWELRMGTAGYGSSPILSQLSEWVDPLNGSTFLLGAWGLMYIVVKTSTMPRKAPVNVYVTGTPPRRHLPKEEQS